DEALIFLDDLLRIVEVLDRPPQRRELFPGRVGRTGGIGNLDRFHLVHRDDLDVPARQRHDVGTGALLHVPVDARTVLKVNDFAQSTAASTIASPIPRPPTASRT